MSKTFIEFSSGFVMETEHPEIHGDARRLTKTEGKQRIRKQSLEELRAMLKAGETVYSVLRHVSPSGMTRRIDFYTIKDNKPRFLTGYMAGALGYRWGDKAGLVVGGCGMDMGFHVVYCLSRVLFPDGFDDDGGRHNDGGYALRHEWL